jgi:hypothetical protein
MHWRARGRNSVPARAIADIAPKRFDECAKRDMPCTVSFLECGGLAAALRRVKHSATTGYSDAFWKGRVMRLLP